MRYKLLLLLFILSYALSFSHNKQGNNSDKLIIGLTETPPFVLQENGEFSGLSIASWELVNQKLNRDFEYKLYPNLGRLLSAIEKREVDLSINPVSVTESRMRRMDFSQPYFISHTGIAQKKESIAWNFFQNLLSWDFISAFLILVGIIFIFGFLVWLFERKKNSEEFGGKYKGLWQGFWWSAVTMTTVGYGDKSPRTFGGRIIGLIWMFMAVIIISSLTAGIASSLTVQSMNDEINGIQDLSKFNVVTVSASSAAELLGLYNVRAEKVENAQEGMQELLEGEASLFIYDEPILRYGIDQKDLKDELEVLPKTLKKDYYSYSFPKNSPLLEEINPVLVSVLKSMEWSQLIIEYR